MRRIGVLPVAMIGLVLLLLSSSRIASIAPSVRAAEQRRWRLLNPSQNRHSVSFEVRGRNGNSTSDDWNDETPITTGSLEPGRDQTLNCDQWYSLDIKWHLNTPDYDPTTDIFYVSLVCYGENYVWNHTNDNVREYTFPRR
ncbi:MAG: hypothetical protein WCF17_21565 [Terracidiphilus sp.]